jgi:hypothetical protein
MRRIEAAKLVRLQILGYLRDNPTASIEEARADLAQEIRDEFGESAWLELLMKLLLELLYILH